MLGFLGDLFAGWKRVPKHIGQQGDVTGWFRRSMGGYLILKELNSTNGQLRAKPYFWQMLLCIIVIVANIFIVFQIDRAKKAGAENPFSIPSQEQPE
jgi:hypothetical protein